MMEFLKSFKLFFVSVFCVLLLAACHTSNTPGGVAQDFVKTMVVGDTDKFIELIDTSDLDEKGIDRLRDRLDQIAAEVKKETDAKNGLKSIEIISKEVTDETASVTMKANWGNGQIKNFPPLPLKKIDGQWKVKFR